MISRRFFGITSLICLIPAILGAIAAQFYLKEIEIPLGMKIILFTGTMAIFIYAVAAIVLFMDNRQWWTVEKFEKERKGWREAKEHLKIYEENYEDARKALVHYVLRHEKVKLKSIKDDTETD